MQLANAQKVDMGNFSDEVNIGPNNAPITLTLVVNPLCNSCWNVFRELDRLIQFCNGHVKGSIRFLVWLGDKNKSSSEIMLDYEVSVLIISMGQCGNRDGVQSALENWFSSRKGFTKREFEKWRDKYSSQHHGERKKAEICLRLHTEWAKRASIRETPTILLNDVKLPLEIQVEDLKYFLLRQIEN